MDAYIIAYKDLTSAHPYYVIHIYYVASVAMHEPVIKVWLHIIEPAVKLRITTFACSITSAAALTACAAFASYAEADLSLVLFHVNYIICLKNENASIFLNDKFRHKKSPPYGFCKYIFP